MATAPAAGVGSPHARHRYDRALPSTVSHLVAMESATEVQAIVTGIRTATSANPIDVELAHRTLGRMRTFIDLKGRFDDGPWATLVTMLLELAMTPGVHQTRLNQLLPKLSLLIRSRKGDADPRLLDVSWRPLYEHFRSRFLTGLQLSAQCAGELAKQTVTQWCTVIRDLNRFFDPATAKDVIEEFEPSLSSSTDRYQFTALALLRLFLPRGAAATHLPAGTIDHWFDVWSRVDFCQQWDSLWFAVMAQVRKRGPSDVDFTPHLPFMFYKLQSFAKLPVNGRGPKSRMPDMEAVMWFSHIPDGMKKFAKLCAALMSASVLEQLALFLRAVSTYFQPSNTDRHSFKLATFVNVLCFGFAKRVGHDRGAEAAGPSTLTNDLIRGFVDITLPAVRTLLFSQMPMLVRFASATLKHLACIHPAAVAPVVSDFALYALDPAAAHQSHLGPNALLALASVVQPLLWPKPYLASVLPTLLNLALPALDPSHPVKTACALEFVVAVVSVVPIHDATSTESSTAALPPPEYDYSADVSDSKFDDDTSALFTDAWAATAGICQWSFLVLDRLFVLLETQLDKSKHGHGLERVPVALLYSTLFQQMSDDVYTKAQQRVLSWVGDLSSSTAAVKQVAQLLAAVTLRDPVSSLRKFLPLVVPPITSDAPSKAALVWNLRLLSGVVRRSGPACVAHRDDIANCIRVGFAHDDKGVRQAAGRALRHTLQALLDTYPTETKSTTPSDLARGFLWQHWAAPTRWNAVDMQWHVPQPAEVEFATALVQEHVMVPLKDLRAMLASGDLDGASWRTQLQHMRAGLRGAVSALVDSPGADGDDTVLAVGSAATFGAGTGVEGAPSMLRPEALAVCVDVVAHVRESMPSDIRTLKLALKVASFLVQRRGPPGNHVMAEKQVTAMLKRALMNRCFQAHQQAAIAGEPSPSSPSPTRSLSPSTRRRSSTARAAAGAGSHSSRVLMVSRLYSHFKRRQNAAEYAVPRALHAAAYPVAAGTAVDEDSGADHPVWGRLRLARAEEPYAAAINTFVDVCMHNYDSLRNAMVSRTGQALRTFPWLRKSVYRRLVDVLRSDAVLPAAAVTGACSLLQGLVYPCNPDWVLTSSLIRTVVASSQLVARADVHDQEKMQQALLSLFVKYTNVWVPVSGLAHADRNRELSTQLTADLLAMLVPAACTASDATAVGVDGRRHPWAGPLPPSPLHWKYQLMATTALASLVHPSPHCGAPVGVWLWFMSAALSDVVPLRDAAVRGLASLLYCACRWPHTAVGLDAVSKAFQDPAYVEQLVAAVSANHTQAFYTADGRAGAAGLWSSGVQELLAAVQPAVHHSHHARFNPPGSFFVVAHAQLFHHVYEFLPASLPTFLSALTTLGLRDGEDARVRQVTCAEAAAGFWRRLSCMQSATTPDEAFDDTHASPLTSDVDGDVAHVLGFTDEFLSALSLEWVPDWSSVLHYALRNRSPVQLGALCKYVFANASKALQSSAGASAKATDVSFAPQTRWLKLVLPVLVECAAATGAVLPFHRPAGDTKLEYDLATDAAATAVPAGRPLVFAMFGALLPTLHSCLGHSYKAVREEIGRLMAMATALAWDPATPEASFTMEGVLGALQAVMDESLAAAESKTGGEHDEGTAAWENHCKETVLYCVVAAVSTPDPVQVAPFVTAMLPLLVATQKDPDPDLSMLAKHVLVTASHNLRLHTPAAILPTLTSLSTESWRAKVGLLELLSVFRANHLFLLHNDGDDSLRRLATDMLRDKQVEVQDAASKALIGFAATMSDAEQVVLMEAFHPLIATKLPRRKPTEDMAPEEVAKIKKRTARALAKRHAGLLGAAAIILSHPYDLPDFLPDVLERFARHLRDPNPIASTVKRVFGEFKRTHQDNWAQHKLKFTPEQLTELVDLLVSPSYYA